MNRAAKEEFYSKLISSIFFNESKEVINNIINESYNNQRKYFYKKFLEQLNSYIIEKKKREKKEFNEEKKIVNYYYSDEDLCYLKDALKNKEISIIDLTYDEALLLHVDKQYKDALRIVYSKLNLTKKENEKYDKIYNSLNNKNTSLRVILNMYKEAKKK